MFIFCPVHFWDFLKWVLTPSSYFVIHLEQSFSFLAYWDKRSVWEVCSVADAISYFRVCHASPSFCITLLFSWIFHLMWVYSVDLHFFFFFLTWPHHLACGILVPNLGSNPWTGPALEARSLNHRHPGKSLFCWFLFKTPLLLSFHPHLYTQTPTQNHHHLHVPLHHFVSQLTYIPASNT